MHTESTAVEFIDQSADALRLTLVDGECDLGQFSILSEATLRLPRGDVIQAGIIGASHFLSVGTGARRFTEVFACTDAAAPNARARYTLNEIAGRQISFPGYSFRACRVPWNKGEGARDRLLSRIAGKEMCEIGLSYVFPDSPEGDPAHRGLALTALLVRVIPKGFVLRTLHAYPGDAMVFTKTIQEVRR